MRNWKVEYKGYLIEVQNSWHGEKLLVNGELQDEQIGIASRSRLFGEIKLDNGSKEKIKVSMGSIFRVHCKIFVNNSLIFGD